MGTRDGSARARCVVAGGGDPGWVWRVARSALAGVTAPGYKVGERLFDRRLLRAEARIGTHDQFGETRLGFRLASQEGAENRAEEA
jgi:hypothetical protein